MMDAQLKPNETFLSPGLRLRPVQWSDLEAVTQLVYDVCEADGDTTVAVTAEEMKHEWETPGFQLERDAFLVETSEGRVVGFEEFSNTHKHAVLHTDGYVHPEFKGRGIGTSLLRAVEQRAWEQMALAAPDVRVSLRSTTDNKDLEGHALHRNEGYQPLRYHWRMEIVLNDPPHEPDLPEGIELRPFIKGEHDIAVWQAQNESFRDHWGSHDVTFEEWQRSRFGDPEFDPSLWKIGWDGEQVAGVSLNRYRMGIGWIRTLGVRRPWRKRGLGEALLLHSFGEFYRRSSRTIGLGVDAQNPTGATRLYQKVGMYAASEFITFEKELRAGREIDEE
ncbi:MAG TPA: GNAT family N-acetyltransferase [Anaerolineales bacterium]|nr:GNAT family N-acetyltransferase [Anaerolineales bacterium]